MPMDMTATNQIIDGNKDGHEKQVLRKGPAIRNEGDQEGDNEKKGTMEGNRWNRNVQTW